MDATWVARCKDPSKPNLAITRQNVALGLHIGFLVYEQAKLVGWAGQRAFATADKSWPKIVFMHDPALFQIKDRFNIAFAGHLHGGQVFVPGIGAIVTTGRAPRTWAKHDWIEFELGSLFVSSGIGTSILPIRVNVPPEYVVAQLSRKSE